MPIICLLIFCIGVNAEDLWYSIFLKNHKIGYSHIIKKTTGKKTLIIDSTKLTVSRNQKQVRQILVIESEFNKDFSPISFSSKKFQEGQTEFIIQGKFHKNEFKIVNLKDSNSIYQSFEIDSNCYLSSTLPYIAAKGGIIAGSRYFISIIDELGGRIIPCSVFVGNRFRYNKNEGFYLTYTLDGGKIESWISQEGHLIKSISGDLSIIKTSKQKALTINRIIDLFAIFQIPVKGKINRNKLRVKFKGIKGPFNLIQSKRQKKLDDGSWIISKGSRPQTYTKPNLDTLANYLKPTPYIESENKVLKTRALAIVKKETDPVKKLEKLNNWVFKWIKTKDHGLIMATALEAYEKKQGDCSEHAFLLSALCKAVDIPTRLILGIAGNKKNQFTFHMWIEAFVGEWVEVDPTWKQFPIDSNHFSVERTIGNPKNLNRAYSKLTNFLNGGEIIFPD